MPDKLIALTFDDGPNETVMLDAAKKLSEYGAKGTFFFIGKQITVSNEYHIKKVHELGHEIGNHSYSHTHIAQMTEAEIREDYEKTQDLIEKIIGERPKFYRPPFLEFNDTMVQVIDLPFAGCGVSAGDGTDENIAADRAWRVTSNAYDGVIVLMHCASNCSETVEALNTIIPELRAQGYEFVTLSELFARMEINPEAHNGVLYEDVNTTKE